MNAADGFKAGKDRVTENVFCTFANHEHISFHAATLQLTTLIVSHTRLWWRISLWAHFNKTLLDQICYIYGEVVYKASNKKRCADVLIMYTEGNYK